MSDKFYLATFIKSNGLLFDGYDISLGIRGKLFYFISGYSDWNNMSMYFNSWINYWCNGRITVFFSMFVARYNDKLSDCCQGSWWITFIWMKKAIWINGFNGWKVFDKKKDLPFEVRIIGLIIGRVIEERITIINNTHVLFTYHHT